MLKRWRASGGGVAAYAKKVIKAEMAAKVTWRVDRRMQYVASDIVKVHFFVLQMPGRG
jgi:hypothetical protein